MISLFSSLANLQMQMQSASSQRVAMNLQRLANSTLEISFKQEELSHALREQISAQDGADRSAIRALAEEQQSYARAVGQIADELHEISKVTLVVPEALLKALGQCIQNMESSLLFLEQAKPFMSTSSAAQATTTLNEITIDLLRACKNCSGGGGGQSQGAPMMQRLLSGQQQVLRETEHMLAMRAGQEKMMQQMQAEVERLAGQQRSLKELAEQIREDLDRDETPLGRMDRIIDEMEEVIRDIEGGVVDESTLQKEERILSRLLDAQRSIHSRDYEKKRTSETAAEMYSDATGIPASRQQSQMLREEIRRAMALKAPGEFEDLIRLYFRALAEEATTRGAAEE
jgi:myosin heavy subunit